ncbi:MAG: hypothetical protein KF764_13705 [Labilithrix sp.]|nr:hypothetical protein [Labilithrix sp.]
MRPSRRSRTAPQRTARIATKAILAASVFAGAAACVDLFHSTDFATLCAADPAACAPETGAEAGADVVTDARPDTARPLDFCDESPFVAYRRAARACGYLGACLGTSADSSFGACMIRALAAYDCAFNPSLRPRGANAALWECLWTVASCSDLSRCVFGTDAPPCPGGAESAFTACNLDGGSVVVECGLPKVALGMSACALRGQTCARIDPSNSICAGRRGGACTGEARCEGSSAVVCKSAGGIDSDEGVDCAGYGDGRCARDDAGVACAPPARAGACAPSASSAIACSDGGEVAESCVDGRAVKIDCAAIDMTCNAAGVPTHDPFSACQTRGAGGTCATSEDECAGTSLRSCVRGASFELACTDVDGLGACTKAPGRNATCTVK